VRAEGRWTLVCVNVGLQVERGDVHRNVDPLRVHLMDRREGLPISVVREICSERQQERQGCDERRHGIRMIHQNEPVLVNVRVKVQNQEQCRTDQRGENRFKYRRTVQSE